jgi:hypothetical protein
LITEHRVGSLAAALTTVKDVRNTWRAAPDSQEEIWFRGQSVCGHRLIPGLYRPDVMALGYDEESIFAHFKALAHPLVRREPSEWEWYFLAQHHGLRTRLLDWTENLLAAIHFAVSGPMATHTQRSFAAAISTTVAPVFDDACPVVWMMDAGSFNVATCGPDKDQIFTVPSERANFYLIDEVAKRHTSNEYPLAILSARSNDRIVAQQGCFTIHGWNQAPIESLAEHSSTFHVAKLMFDRANLATVWDELQTCGVHVLSLFPDLDSVAKRVLWICQNESPSLSPVRTR